MKNRWNGCVLRLVFVFVERGEMGIEISVIFNDVYYLFDAM